MAEIRVSPSITWLFVTAYPPSFRMNPEPLPEGVSIETTASPYWWTSSLTGAALSGPDDQKPVGSTSLERTPDAPTPAPLAASPTFPRCTT